MNSECIRTAIRKAGKHRRGGYRAAQLGGCLREDPEDRCRGAVHQGRSESADYAEGYTVPCHIIEIVYVLDDCEPGTYREAVYRRVDHESCPAPRQSSQMIQAPLSASSSIGSDISRVYRGVYGETECRHELLRDEEGGDSRGESGREACRDMPETDELERIHRLEDEEEDEDGEDGQ